MPPTTAYPDRTIDIAAASKRGMHTKSLSGALLLRGAIHAAFATWLIVTHPGWTDIFQIGAYAGLVDGTLGLFTVSRIVPFAPEGSPRLLAIMTFVDAIGRLTTSVVLLAFPGIPDFFVTLGSLFGLVGATTAGLGLVALAVWLLARLRVGRAWSLDYDALFDPLAIAAAVSMVVGYILFVNPPVTVDDLRTLGLAVCGALTVVFMMASFGAIVHRRRA